MMQKPKDKCKRADGRLMEEILCPLQYQAVSFCVEPRFVISDLKEILRYFDVDFKLEEWFEFYVRKISVNETKI